MSDRFWQLVSFVALIVLIAAVIPFIVRPVEVRQAMVTCVGLIGVAGLLRFLDSRGIR